jgi:hypothetical protein
MRRLLLCLFLALAPPLALNGCATIQNLIGTVETAVPQTARQQLAVAEYAFQAALKAVNAQVDAGAIKGDAAKNVSTALGVAKAALDAARVAVRAGNTNAPTLIAAASAAVADLVALVPQ